MKVSTDMMMPFHPCSTWTNAFADMLANFFLHGTVHADSLHTEERTPVAKRRKKETTTEDTPVETVELSMCVQYLLKVLM